MSVAPDRVENLPQHRRPPAWGGTSKDPVFVIASPSIQGPLQYRPDHEEHGVIEPQKSMSIEQLQLALCATRESWELV